MSRPTQIALSIIIAPLLGLTQGVPSILIYLVPQEIRQWDAWKTYLEISLLYGACWFVPALILADAVVWRRVLGRAELARYVRIVVICTLVIGLITPAYLLLLGYPLTAVAILIAANYCRRHPVSS
jgi:hypothetical protein